MLLNLFTLVVIIINLLYIHSFWLSLIFGIYYIVSLGYKLTKNWHLNFIHKVLLGSGIILAILSSVGAITLYIYELNILSISIILMALSVSIFFIYQSQFNISTISFEQPLPKSILQVLLAIIYFILTLLNLRLLFEAKTFEAIHSPWEVIPTTFLIIYAISSIVLFIILLSKPTSSCPNWVKVILISLQSFLTINIALIIYPLGFGFDTHIHQATENIIWQQGYIVPKTIYYAGYYALVIILSHLFQIIPAWIDKLLIPLILGVYLIPCLYITLKKIFNAQINTALSISVLFLALPFTIFTTNTPQALANLVLLLTISTGLMYVTQPNKQNLSILLLLGLTGFLIHPLAGIPGVIFIIILYLINQNIKPILLLSTTIILSIIIPLAFIMTQNGSWIATPTLDLITHNIPSPIWVNKFNPILDFAYLYKLNIIWVIIAAAILTFLRNRNNKIILTCFTSFLIVFLNGVFLNAIQFPSIIDYEQSAYSDRVLHLSLYFLLPVLAYPLIKYYQKVLASPNQLIKIFTIILMTIVITSSLYVSYPTQDSHWNEYGINLSLNDILAVRSIASQTQNDYIVLSNQIIGAAAIREFGFKKYYTLSSGEAVFYYPVPTSSPLYKLYLDYVTHNNSLNSVSQAMELTQVNEVYLVLNRYWWSFPVIVKKAMNQSQKFWTIDNGEIYIFKYVKKTE